MSRGPVIIGLRPPYFAAKLHQISVGGGAILLDPTFVRVLFRDRNHFLSSRNSQCVGYFRPAQSRTTSFRSSLGGLLAGNHGYVSNDYWPASRLYCALWYCCSSSQQHIRKSTPYGGVEYTRLPVLLGRLSVRPSVDCLTTPPAHQSVGRFVDASVAMYVFSVVACCRPST
jgi:hypothetical protein